MRAQVKKPYTTNLPFIRLEDHRNPSELMLYRDRYLVNAIERKMRDSGRFTLNNMSTLPILARQTVNAIKKAVCQLGGYPGFEMTTAEAQRYKSQFPNEFSFLELITQLKDAGMEEASIIAQLTRDYPGK